MGELDHRLSMQQVMAHHREKVFHMMLQTTSEPNNILTWDMFITHQDVWNLSSKKGYRDIVPSPKRRSQRAHVGGNK